MPLSATKTHLVSLEQDRIIQYIVEICRAKIELEILNPKNLGKEWENVNFVQVEIDSESLVKLEKIIRFYQPKRKYTWLLESQFEVEQLELNNIGQREELLLKIVESLEKYLSLQARRNSFQNFLNRNHGQNIFFGEKLNEVLEQMEVFYANSQVKTDEKTILQAKLPEFKIIEIIDVQAIICTDENLASLEYFLKKTDLEKTVQSAVEIMANLSYEAKEIEDFLNKNDFNPKKITAEQFQQLQTFQTHLQTQNIAKDIANKFFTLLENTEYSYGFLVVREEDTQLLEQISERYVSSFEQINWNSQIVAWKNYSWLKNFDDLVYSNQISFHKSDPIRSLEFIFCLFFAISLNDAIYGILLWILSSLFLTITNLKPKLQNIAKTIQNASLFTILVGVLTANWAGNLFSTWQDLKPVKDITQNFQLIEILGKNQAPINILLQNFSSITPIYFIFILSVFIGLCVSILGVYFHWQNRSNHSKTHRLNIAFLPIPILNFSRLALSLILSNSLANWINFVAMSILSYSGFLAICVLLLGHSLNLLLMTVIAYFNSLSLIYFQFLIPFFRGRTRIFRPMTGLGSSIPPKFYKL